MRCIWLEVDKSESIGELQVKQYDSRRGRALDAMYPHLSTLKDQRALRAIRACNLDLSELHRDATDVTFCGAYEPIPRKRRG